MGRERIRQVGAGTSAACCEWLRHCAMVSCPRIAGTESASTKWLAGRVEGLATWMQVHQRLAPVFRQGREDMPQHHGRDESGRV